MWITYWHPLKAEDGGVFSASVAAEVITEQKRVKAALHLRTNSWRLVRSNSPVLGRIAGCARSSRSDQEARITLPTDHRHRTRVKNPLNFVTNFSNLSIELAVELQKAIKSQEFNDEKRSEIHDLLDTLQGNLLKLCTTASVRTRSLRYMFVHSRQISGEHRSVDLNALVEESLNLAYHGARAEKGDFNITLERSFDPAAGEVNLLPQEITRVLLNLISNSFYATTQRKAEANGGRYEPIMIAATKNLGDNVEIRIRDNGTGMPSEVKEKMFNPFFTTKPAGEGTGLGLSISHDIIVKQHGGSIEVDTQPGEFTEFRIVLARAGASLIKSGERTSH